MELTIEDIKVDSMLKLLAKNHNASEAILEQLKTK